MATRINVSNDTLKLDDHAEGYNCVYMCVSEDEEDKDG